MDRGYVQIHPQRLNLSAAYVPAMMLDAVVGTSLLMTEKSTLVTEIT